MLIKYKEEMAERARDAIAASGVERDVLSSQQKFATHLESLGITVPTKKSPTTGKQIPAFGKNDTAYLQMCNMYPEHRALWDAREVV